MSVTWLDFLVGKGPDKTDIDSLLCYSLSLPVTATVIAMPHVKVTETQ
jgi:hypothetical protein